MLNASVRKGAIKIGQSRDTDNIGHKRDHSIGLGTANANDTTCITIMLT
jgi:hypothetical protein